MRVAVGEVLAGGDGDRVGHALNLSSMFLFDLRSLWMTESYGSLSMTFRPSRAFLVSSWSLIVALILLIPTPAYTTVDYIIPEVPSEILGSSVLNPPKLLLMLPA